MSAQPQRQERYTALYQDEQGAELWRAARAEYVPTGTLITAADGGLFLAISVTTTRAANERSAPTLQIVVRRLSTWKSQARTTQVS